MNSSVRVLSIILGLAAGGAAHAAFVQSSPIIKLRITETAG